MIYDPGYLLQRVEHGSWNTSPAAQHGGAGLQENGIANKLALTKAEENCLILCAGQGAYEGDALDDTQALADLLKDQGMPAHLEI